MGKRLSQLNQIEQATPENYVLLDGENFLESKKVKLKDIDIENFNTTKFYNREEADEEFISKANVQQTYDPASEDITSGKAVAEAVSGRVPKIADTTMNAPFDNVLMQKNRYTWDEDLSDDLYFITGSDDESIAPQPYFIARRDSNGNIKSNTPIKNLDCANKKYVDDAIASGGGGGGTTDYEYLSNKPSINGVELVGNKTTADLGIDIPSLENYYTKTEIDTLVGDIETLLGGI